MTLDVNQYVESCDVCQRRKIPRQRGMGLMETFEINEAFEMVAVDCIEMTKCTTRSNRHIFVAIDMFTRFVEARATDTITSAKFAIFLMENLICLYGPPKQLLTDGAQTFGAELVKELTRLYAISHIRSTPLHSQGNAVVERVNATLGDKLAMVIEGNEKYNSDNWDEALPMVVFAINSTLHTSTGFSPYELLYARQPKLH